MPEGEPAELPGVTGIGELDLREGDVATPLAQHAGHRVGHPTALLGVGVVDEKIRGLTWRVHLAPPSTAKPPQRPGLRFRWWPRHCRP